MLKRISFLVGAGVSIPAGFPTVGEITHKVLSGKGVMRHTDGNYYFEPPLYGIPDEYIPRVRLFLNRIKIEIDLYYLYQSDRDTDYEDLYYVASQIRDSEAQEYDNPAVQPLIEKIQREIDPILLGNQGEINNKWELFELAKEATHYIRDIVWHMLSRNSDTLEHLSCIKDACLDNQLSSIDIHTLNHDTLLEQFLAENNIQVTDGFTAPKNQMRYWDSLLFDKNPLNVRLIKLHGSLNWFRFRSQGDNGYNEYIGIPLEWDYWHIKDVDGNRQWPTDGRPMFLAGTFNKMLDYSAGIYADLHYHFYNSLRMTSILVVSGYSFRDKGINNQITNWINSSSDKKIIIIHPEPKRLKSVARGSISNKWDGLIEEKKLSLIEKPIENTSWQDILNSI